MYTGDTKTIVANLIEILGAAAVAALGGVDRASIVASWAHGQEIPGADAESRLRLAYAAAEILRERLPDNVVRNWFFGANHLLHDEMPLAEIAGGRPAEIEDAVLGAAQAMISH